MGPDIALVSETFERESFPLNQLLDKTQYKSHSFHRTVSSQSQVGGGCAVIYNGLRFEMHDTDIVVPDGIEAVWMIMKPRQKDNVFRNIKQICVGSIYISPRSQYKSETIDHIIQTIHCMRAKYNNEIKFLISGDFNRTQTTNILDSYGGLQQICSIPTHKKGGTLELVLTDIGNLYYPPTSSFPLQVDSDKPGTDSDHNVIILAPISSNCYQTKRKKRTITTRPLPSSMILNFGKEITQHDWKHILDENDPDIKVEQFHNYLRSLLEKYFPEKTIKISSLDKKWMTSELKQLMRQIKREFHKNRKSDKWKKLKQSLKS